MKSQVAISKKKLHNEAEYYFASQYNSFININISHYFKLKEINSALLFHMKVYECITDIDRNIYCHFYQSVISFYVVPL